MEDRKLFCLMYGEESAPFHVQISGDSQIADLKRFILVGISEMRITSRHLNLWKLNDPLILKPSKTLSRRVSDLGSQLSQYAVFLEPSDTVSSYFPEQPSKIHLHIIIEVPSVNNLPGSSGTDVRKRPHSPVSLEPSKRQTLDSHLWLTEVHSKIWGKKNLRKDLFREVTLTMAHHDELQKRLTELQTNHTVLTTEEFLRIKLDILQLDLPSLIPDLVPSDETETFVDSVHVQELADLFPATIKYLDLSSLKLETSFTGLPLPLLIREEYTIISDLMDRTLTARNSVHLGGQPGTGKTAYIHFRMIEYMLEGRPFIYQSFHGDVYLFTHDLQLIDNKWRPKEPIVAFVDADNKTFVLAPCIEHPVVRIVTASSPNPSVEDYAKQLDLPKNPIPYIQDLWSSREFLLTGLFLHAQHFTFHGLKESSLYFGFNPRRCFWACISDEHMEEAKGDVEFGICSIPQSENLVSLCEQTCTTSGLSHSIFQISPLNHERALTDAQILPVSTWVLDLLFAEYETRASGAAHEFYILLASKPYAQTVRGRMFEGRVLKYFDSLQAPRPFKVRPLGNLAVSQSDTVDLVYPGQTPRHTFPSKDAFTSPLESAVKNHQSLHLVPQDPNFLAVDSILFNPQAHLTCFQITLRDTHPIKVVGLNRIQSWINGTPLKDTLKPTVDRPWHLVFVVPVEQKDKFQNQDFTGDTPTGLWGRKIDQFVLGIDDKILWATPKKL